MGSWAAIASTAAPKRAAAVTTIPEGVTVVVDANAIISGLQIDRLGGTAVTVPAALREVRDVASRQRLATLPLGLAAHYPSDDAIAAVRKFASLTGDIGTLSTVDLQLLALTWDLTRARHGPGALREVPPPPKARSKAVKQKDALPGWGEDNEGWAALDAQPDTPSGVQGSRILSSAPVELDTTQHESTSNAKAGPAAGEGARGEGNDEGDVEGEVEGEDGEWETAASSRNAYRRKKRREVKRQQRAAVSAVAPSTPERRETAQSSSNSADGSVQLGAALQQMAIGTQITETLSTEEGIVQQQDVGEAAAENAVQSDAQDGQTDGQTALQADEEAAEQSHTDAEESDSESDGEPQPELDVKIVTADFAMQNVALQMGMCLLTPDGLRINRLSRWALRCTACMAVTHEHGRIFCPKCGNNALQRVHVVVHSDGSETYGVRKNHVLKGTKFPLPSPKGGRNSKNPVLCEDVLMQQAARIRKMTKNKDPAVDPFAPEYNEDTWLKPHTTNKVANTQQFQLAQAANMTALLASYKHNPNERSKANRSNRRK